MPNHDQSKQSLIAEKEKLEKELQTFARVNPDNPQDWQALAVEDNNPDFRDETANRLEEWEDRESAANSLGQRLQEITAALERLEKGTYGLCKICGKEIETDRLTANPAATTCKSHLA